MAPTSSSIASSPGRMLAMKRWPMLVLVMMP
jgi:hypothetical protein